MHDSVQKEVLKRSLWLHSWSIKQLCIVVAPVSLFVTAREGPILEVW